MTAREVRADTAAMRAASKKICRTKKTARQFLIKYGFITPTGKLTKRYQ